MSSMEPTSPAAKQSVYTSKASSFLLSSKILLSPSPPFSPSPFSASRSTTDSQLANSHTSHYYRRSRLFVFTSIVLLLLLHYLLLLQAKSDSTTLRQNVSDQGTTVSPEKGSSQRSQQQLSSSHSKSLPQPSSSRSFDRLSKDLPVQWTEQDKVPIAWVHQVRPLIIASLPSSPSSPPSPSDVITIRVTLPLNSSVAHHSNLTTLNLSQIELILSSPLTLSRRKMPNNTYNKEPHHHHYPNHSVVDFLSPHFVFAEHLSVIDEEGEIFTEERRKYDHYFQSPDDDQQHQQHQQQSPAEKVIRRLFSATSDQIPPEITSSAADEVCHFFTGQTVVHQTNSNAGSNQQSQQASSTTVNKKDDHEKDDDINRQSSSSTATIQLCSHGSLNGIITWAGHGHLLLEPTTELCQAVEEKQTSNLTKTRTFHFCTHRLHYAPFSEEIEGRSSHENSPPLVPPPRNRRSISEARTIEMMIVTDMSMWKSHGDALQEYVFSLVASVAHIFRHSSIGNRISLKLIRLYAMRPTSSEDPQQAHFLPSDGEDSSAQNTLRRFCHWQHAHNQADDSDPRHYDIAILLTRRDLCRKSSGGSVAASRASTSAFSSLNEQPGRKMSCDTIGLAHSGQICDPSSSCAIVEDTGLSSAFTIAHELGHVLGIPHDDEDKCKRLYNRTQQPTSNVMARMIDIKSHMWSWSACSEHFITEYLDSGNGKCLLDDNSENAPAKKEYHQEYYQLMMGGDGGDRSYSGQSRSHRSGAPHQESYLRFRQPGEYYTATAQCRHVFGKNSEVCVDMPQCRRLWCTHSGLGCRTQHMPWADGTQCKPPKDAEDPHSTDWWCQEGECVRKDVSSMRPVDGGWGDWSEYSNCSLNCGGGFSQSKRKCNRPSPKNGGKYCVGERIRYKSCATDPCDPPIRDIREQQCAAYTGKKEIKGVDASVKWVPFHSRNPADFCKLICADQKTGNYYQLAERVKDGTPCSPDSYDICVNGKCLAAGCDRVLGSNRTLDQCGICDGDNSTCAEVSQTVAGGLGAHGYNPVVVIPAGASNFWVRKGRSQVEENWLAIRADDGAYMLNGRWTVNKYERKWHYGGATIEYSGVVSPYNEESIHASRPIDRPIYIEILCVGELRYPDISYSYMISLGGGGKKTNSLIHLVEQGGSPPAIEQQLDSASCGPGTGRFNNETFVWDMGNWTECRCETKHKLFRRERPVRCIRRLPDNSNQEISDKYCHCFIRHPKPSESEQCTVPASSSVDSDCSLAASSTSSTTTTTTTTEVSTTTATTMASTKKEQFNKLETKLSSALTTSLPLTQKTPVMISASPTTIPSTVQLSQQNFATLKPSTTTTSLRVLLVNTPRNKYNHIFKRPRTTTQPPPPANHWTEWRDWSSCVPFNSTSNCGNGTKSREAQCAAGQNCTEQAKPANQTQDCLVMCPIFEWHYRDEWSPCTPLSSNVCETAGVRTLTAECRDWTGNTTISDHFCEANSTLPVKSQPCTMAIVADARCSTSTQPPTSSTPSPPRPRTLLGGPLVWQTGHWSECSQQCDTGFQERLVSCHRRNRYGTVDPRPLADPTERMNIRRQRGRGRAGRRQENQHQKHLQQLHQKRRKRHNNEINYNYLTDLEGGFTKEEDAEASEFTNYCNIQKKPAANQSCSLGSCVHAGMDDSFVWRTFEWQQCDRTCGDGEQTRWVVCQSVRWNSIVNNTRCDASLKPPEKRACNRRDCGVNSCLDMRERSRTRVDGEYDLTVQGVSIRVYCYGMGSLKQPLEYLQLHSGDNEEDEEENYSQLVHRPSDCSAATSEAEPTAQQRTSTLYFKYVRLNVTTLELIVNDTLFASTKETTTVAAATTLSGGNSRRRSVRINDRSLSFGEAVVQGCESAEYLVQSGLRTVRCHFGGGGSEQQPQQLFAKFSINLQKTGLAVAPAAHWHLLGQGEYVQRSIRRSKSGQKVEGFCGMDTTINSSGGLVFITSKRSSSLSSICLLGCQPVLGGAIPLIVL